MKYFKRIIPAAIVLIAAYACNQDQPVQQPAETPAETAPVKTTPVINYTVVKKYPHDVTAFTEGFLFDNGRLYESTGAPEYLPQTRSAFGIVDVNTGKLDVKAELDKRIYFGEGIVILNGSIYQLTYTNQVGFIYDAKTFQGKGQFGYQNKQGWGLTTEGTNLVMSDGTNYLTYLDPKNFSIVKVLGVTENDYALDYLNELEYINGFIYANVWMKNVIVKIDPASGEVVGKLDLTALVEEAKSNNRNSLELNGIAYDPATDRVLVTGKMWPSIYEIKFDH